MIEGLWAFENRYNLVWETWAALVDRYLLVCLEAMMAQSHGVGRTDCIYFNSRRSITQS